MYSPKFNITNDILANIGLVEAAKEVIKNAPLIPVYEARFVKDAILRSVHHGTHIEGNDLTLTEAKRVIEGEGIVARERDVQEVINYRNVLAYIDRLVPLKPTFEASSPSAVEAKQNRYSQALLKEINRTIAEKVLPAEAAGEYRTVPVVVKNSRTGEVVFQPPPAIEVPFLLEDFFAWINTEEAKKIHPVLRAGIAHYVLVAIHPFVEGNGRTARAFATMLLYFEGYDIKKFFSIEEYFDKDSARYYQAIMETDKQSSDLTSRDLTPWLEYFTQALGVELTRIKEKVKRLSLDLKTRGGVGYQIPLNERQIKLMEYLQENGSLTTAEARKVAPGYSDDTLNRDFNYFLKRGIVKKEGKTKAARYILR